MSYDYFTEEDTLGEVPPIKTREELQKAFQKFRDMSDEDAAAEAYDDAAEFVEAHRIWKNHERNQRLKQSTENKNTNRVQVAALLLATGAGGLLVHGASEIDIGPSPDIVQLTISTITNLNFQIATFLMFVAISLQTFGTYLARKEAASSP